MRVLTAKSYKRTAPQDLPAKRYSNWGDVTAKEQLAADEARVRLLEFALVLLVEVRSFDITKEEVRAVAAIDHRLARLVPHLKVAIVAPQDHEYGIARMWEAFADVPGWTKKVFRERGEAEAWIHRPDSRATTG